MTADLTARVTAALNEAEDAAEKAKRNGQWGTAREWSRELCSTNGDHIAFWSPDRVLALIAADRRVLERHSHTTSYLPTESRAGEHCLCCGNTWPCDDLLDLAARWGVTPVTRRKRPATAQTHQQIAVAMDIGTALAGHTAHVEFQADADRRVLAEHKRCGLECQRVRHIAEAWGAVA